MKKVNKKFYLKASSIQLNTVQLSAERQDAKTSVNTSVVKLTPKTLKKPDFQVASRYYFCEQEEKWAFGDSNDYFYKDVKRNDKEEKEYK